MGAARSKCPPGCAFGGNGSSTTLQAYAIVRMREALARRANEKVTGEYRRPLRDRATPADRQR
jgi:hypothetical protein